MTGVLLFHFANALAKDKDDASATLVTGTDAVSSEITNFVSQLPEEGESYANPKWYKKQQPKWNKPQPSPVAATGDEFVASPAPNKADVSISATTAAGSVSVSASVPLDIVNAGAALSAARAAADAGTDSLRAEPQRDISDSWQSGSVGHGGVAYEPESPRAAAMPPVINAGSQDPQDRLRSAIDAEVKSGTISARQGERLFAQLAPFASRLDEFGDDVGALQKALAQVQTGTVAAAQAGAVATASNGVAIDVKAPEVRVSGGNTVVKVAPAGSTQPILVYSPPPPAARAENAAPSVPIAAAVAKPGEVPAMLSGVIRPGQLPKDERGRMQLDRPLYGAAVDVATGVAGGRSLASTLSPRASALIESQRPAKSKIASLIKKFIGLIGGNTAVAASAEITESPDAHSALRAPASEHPVLRTLASVPVVGAVWTAAVGEDDETTAVWLNWLLPVAMAGLVARAGLQWRRSRRKISGVGR